jgi:branched-chain amino acid transport system ATP-binding protein
MSVPETAGPVTARGTTEDVVLEVRSLKVRYGPIEAVHGISFDVRRGEMVTIIGANGAGKTSTLLAISGVERVAAGTIRLLGQEIQGKPGHRIAAMGLGHVPEGRRIFGRMSVWENLAMGTYAKRTVPSDEDLEPIFRLFPVLKERLRQTAGTLSGGEQQMLAIGRALVAHPQLLLLDEPSMGLAPRLVATIFALIKEVNQAGVTMLLVEQNARMALRTANRGYVLESGNIVLEAAASDLLHNDSVRAAYLGGMSDDAEGRSPSGTGKDNRQ